MASSYTASTEPQRSFITRWKAGTNKGAWHDPGEYAHMNKNGSDLSGSYSGHYPIERRPGELQRLYLQGTAMAPDTEVMLNRIGVGEGWSCLDLGCGPRGITNLLSTRVGASGRVIGLDMDGQFLKVARAGAPNNVEFRQGDAYGSDLPAGSFDLVHMRFVASTAGDPEHLLRESIRLVRPGGIVALQEPDGSSLNCHPPHPAWDRLKAALLGAFSSVGAKSAIGEAALRHRSTSGPRRRAVPAVCHRRSLGRSHGRLPSVNR